MHQERQAAEEKVEEKVRRLSREGGRGYIDRTAGIRRQTAGAKAARHQRDAQNGHAKPEGAMGFPYRAGGGGRQSGGSMGAVSGAPLTGTTYTLYKRSWIADWARILANILRPVMSTNKSLLKILRTDNKRLKTI